MSLVRPLDRYVFGEFWRIFVTTALGFPLLVVIIDLTDNLAHYLQRNLPPQNIFLSYIYWLPDSMFMVLPAAVLFATVFSIGAFTRHSEITAAKASGISFYRLVAPILLGAILACGLDLALGEVVPITNAKRADLLEEQGSTSPGSTRYNFAFAGEYGRVYKVGTLNTDRGSMDLLQIERRGNGPDYPSYVITARSAIFQPNRSGGGAAGSAAGRWTLENGEMEIVPDTTKIFALTFRRMRDAHLTERPAEMMAKPRSPQEMRYEELTRFIRALERSGGDANVLRVERALKIAIPVTCIIIALFGAPLATSTQRGGAAYGIGISLATTMIFLMMIQLTKAIGGKGLIPPDLAAWVPSAIFGTIGLVLMARVRT
ncbi:MAG TPA: LptF/LptG family permease [Gemmatimonadaceae bacterium]|nr:LptF/LptG family permease [Gemmatimonadaceae bacterium]